MAFFVEAGFCGERKGAVKNASQSVFEKLKGDYLHIRNTDAGVDKPADWKALASAFERFAASHTTDREAPLALYNAAILWGKLYLRFGTEEALEKSSELAESVAENYKRSPLADDALLWQADLLLQAARAPAAAAVYRKIIEDYPQSDSRPLAEARLSPAAGGKNLQPVSESEPADSAVLPAERAPGQLLIVLDPGHGGEDWGASGAGGLLEKDVVLAVAFELEKVLKENPRLAVALTRRQDFFMPLPDRIALANRLNADLFVSLHNNASPNQRLQGLQTFYLDSQGDEATRLLVERENSAGQTAPVAVDDLQFMLGDLLQNAKVAESIVLAHFVQQSLTTVMSGKYAGVRDLGVRKAPFYVLVGAHMPCVLTELFFIDNPEDGARLATRDFRRTLARGLASGIEAFLGKQGLLREET